MWLAWLRLFSIHLEWIRDPLVFVILSFSLFCATAPGSNGSWLAPRTAKVSNKSPSYDTQGLCVGNTVRGATHSAGGSRLRPPFWFSSPRPSRRSALWHLVFRPHWFPAGSAGGIRDGPRVPSRWPHVRPRFPTVSRQGQPQVGGAQVCRFHAIHQRWGSRTLGPHLGGWCLFAVRNCACHPPGAHSPNHNDTVIQEMRTQGLEPNLGPGKTEAVFSFSWARLSGNPPTALGASHSASDFAGRFRNLPCALGALIHTLGLCVASRLQRPAAAQGATASSPRSFPPDPRHV